MKKYDAFFFAIYELLTYFYNTLHGICMSRMCTFAELSHCPYTIACSDLLQQSC